MSVHDETDDKLAIDCLLDGVQLSLCKCCNDNFFRGLVATTADHKPCMPSYLQRNKILDQSQTLADMRSDLRHPYRNDHESSMSLKNVYVRIQLKEDTF